MRCSSVFFLLLAVILFSLNSCKKGCTNESAANYNPSAKEDDASCLFCDSVLIDTYPVAYYTYSDNYSQSPHYQEYVLRTGFLGSLYKYDGNYCSALGFHTGCEAGSSFNNFAYVQPALTNLTEDTVILTANFSLGINGTLYSQSGNINQLSIPPLATVPFDNIVYLDCVEFNTASGSFSLNSREFDYK